jgi:ATP-dependent Clp protease ATP-binding subunit ClpX
MPAAAPDACSWCGKPGTAVKKLLGNGTVAICDECVALCADVMDAELGDGWRPQR